MNAIDFEHEVEEDLGFVNSLLELNDDNLAQHVISGNDVQNALLSFQWYLEAAQKGEIIYCPVKPGTIVRMHDLEIKAKQQDYPPAIKYMRQKNGELLGKVTEVTYLEEGRGRFTVSYWIESDNRACEREHEYDFNQFGRDFTISIP